MMHELIFFAPNCYGTSAPCVTLYLVVEEYSRMCLLHFDICLRLNFRDYVDYMYQTLSIVWDTSFMNGWLVYYTCAYILIFHFCSLKLFWKIYIKFWVLYAISAAKLVMDSVHIYIELNYYIAANYWVAGILLHIHRVGVHWWEDWWAIKFLQNEINSFFFQHTVFVF